MLSNNIIHNYCILDTETTGLSAETCELLEIGILRIENATIVKEFNMLTKPKKLIPLRITALNKINDSMVIDAKDPIVAIEAARKFVADSIIVGHNIGFDLSFLNKYSNAFIGIKSIDTVKVARAVFEDNKLKGGYSQGNLELYYGVKNINKHRAIGDCKALFRIIQFLLKTNNNIDIFDYAITNIRRKKVK